MTDIQVRLATSDDELRTCLRIRWTVFVEEQKVPPSLEVDEHDREPATVHALGLYRGVPAGAGRVVPLTETVAKIGRLAVIDDARGHGLGQSILRALEDEARRRGASEVTLSAQVHARAFYQRLGYAAAGEVFDDAGIPHLEMRKSL